MQEETWIWWATFFGDLPASERSRNDLGRRIRLGMNAPRHQSGQQEQSEAHSGKITQSHV